MKQGSKYYPLYAYLKQTNQSEITMTISEIETLINHKLPATAWDKKAWWSNRSKGALQACAWIDAGYHTQNIDLEKQEITFMKFQASYNIQQQDGEIIWNSDSIKALRKEMGLTQAEFAEEMGVRRQTVSEWENNIYQPDRSTSKHLKLVAEKKQRYKT
jgi:DNA-binding transcriptional regulator YiaG